MCHNLLRGLPTLLIVGVFALAGATPNSAAAQDPATTQAAAAAANPGDVASIDAITTAAYACISGEKGEERQWARFRTLFHPDARLIPVQRPAEGRLRARYLSVEEFIAQSDPYFVENGFFEKELHRKTEEFGSIAHHFSTYASYDSATSTEPFARGINSFQLMHDGQRWWIVNIFWQAESAQTPVPAEYLGETDDM